jgi:hypothetical protein
MKDKQMVAELMSWIGLYFKPTDVYDRFTGEKLLTSRDVKYEALAELKRDYKHYVASGGKLLSKV